jgi:hypothetical protein
VNPERPKHLSQYAEECLRALSAAGLGGKLSLGGAIGLSYYLEYRETHDVDAWWLPSASDADRRRVVTLLEETLGSYGTVQTRKWGDVVSVTLAIDGKAIFSFQIAARSAQLEESLPAPWPQGMLLDSLKDLLAAKMAALVERGAPRDFRDIHAVCRAGLADPDLCWTLWRIRRKLAGDDSSADRARLGLLTHLERIELHRPLTGITDESERESAARLRQWFRQEFLNALVD